VNKAQLVDLLSQNTKMTKMQTELFLDAAIEIIQGAIASGKDVKLVGFGTFSSLEKKARKGRNPKTGEVVEIPCQKVPRFRPGKEFKDLLN
jgi:DNA-binding protein HU-beta